jgi:superfamily I DNA/RNA helicase
MSNRVYIPSPQQAKAIRWVVESRGNASMIAVAGAGKTTTIIEMAKRAKGSVAIAAFNTRIAADVKEKVAKAGLVDRVEAGTFHSFGFRAWRKVAPNVRVLKKNGEKLKLLVQDMGVPEWCRAFAMDAAAMAKNDGIGWCCDIEDYQTWLDMVTHHDLQESLASEPGGPVADEMVEEGLEWALRLLRRSNDVGRQMIDFGDMLYLPLLYEARIWQHSWVFVDEAQDSNAVRRGLAKRMLRPDGRAVFVGDPRQAINGFAGADNNAMEIIAQEFRTAELPLTVTYRCPRAVVREAQAIVSHITTADSAPEGRVMKEEFCDFIKRDDLQPTDAVLCRNTKPLVQTAYSLIKRGIGCRIEGKDIGNGLLAMANRWKVRNLQTLKDKLQEFCEKQTEKLLAEKKESQAEALADKVESLVYIIESLSPQATPNDLRERIAGMFGDSDEVGAKPLLTLSTVHRSKGREWPRVFLLGRDAFMPSKYARQPWQLEQEDNLIYVALTRVMETLVYVGAPPNRSEKNV